MVSLNRFEGVSWRILQQYPPSFTPPDHEIVPGAVAAATEILGRTPVTNMRVGASDSRLYRMFGVPSVVSVHALTALAFLSDHRRE